jgi:hypothetical protein
MTSINRTVCSLKTIEFETTGYHLGTAIRLVLARDEHRVEYGIAENPVIKFTGVSSSGRVMEVYMDLDAEGVSVGTNSYGDDGDRYLSGKFFAEFGRGSVNFAGSVLDAFFRSRGEAGGLDIMVMAQAVGDGKLKFELGDEREASFSTEKEAADWEAIEGMVKNGVRKNCPDCGAIFYHEPGCLHA